MKRFTFTIEIELSDDEAAMNTPFAVARECEKVIDTNTVYTAYTDTESVPDGYEDAP